MKSKNRQITALSLSGIFLATTALAMNAPDDMKLAKIREAATVYGLPQLSFKLDPKQPRPATFEFYIRGGNTIPVAAALDGTINGSSDPRLGEGNATCTVITEREVLPPALVLETRPSIASKTVTFASGRQITIQQVIFTSAAATMECYKVGKAPLSARDLKAALGPKAAILLSPAQEADLLATEKLRGILARATGPAAPSIEADSSAAKNATSPSAPPNNDPIVDESTQGNFVSRAPAR